jgi:hypothetical protein
MAKTRTKGRKKLTRSGRKKAYYTRQYIVTARNKARRALRRERRIAEKAAWKVAVERGFVAYAEAHITKDGQLEGTLVK